MDYKAENVYHAHACMGTLLFLNFFFTFICEVWSSFTVFLFYIFLFPFWHLKYPKGFRFARWPQQQHDNAVTCSTALNLFLCGEDTLIFL